MYTQDFTSFKKAGRLIASGVVAASLAVSLVPAVAFADEAADASTQEQAAATTADATTDTATDTTDASATDTTATTDAATGEDATAGQDAATDASGTDAATDASGADAAASTDTTSTTTKKKAKKKTPSSYKVKFDSKGGSKVKTQKVKAKKKVKKPTAPTRSGYLFKGWYKGKAKYKFSKKVTSNFTLKAKWEKIVAKVDSKGVQEYSGKYITAAKMGKTVGATKGSVLLTGIAIKPSKETNLSGKVKYRVYSENGGWSKWVENGKLAGRKNSWKTLNVIQAKLTGKLADSYNIYYRVNVEGYGWMAWTKNGAKAGAVNLLREVRGYQVKLVSKKDKAAKKAIKQANKGKIAYATKKKHVEEFMGTVMTKKAQSHSSSTSWLIMIDRHVNHLCIFRGKKGDWKLYRSWRCSTGKPWTPTITGSYSLGSKGYSFGHGYTCYYYSQISGNYLIHSVKYYEGSRRIRDGRLGQNVSKGCVRLAIENAKFIYDHAPYGSRIYIY